MYARSDILKRHANTHKDILIMHDEEDSQELRRRNAVQIQSEERRQELMEIAQQENIPISHCNDVIQSPTSMNLEEEQLQDNRDYLDNIELCKQINTSIDKGEYNKNRYQSFEKMQWTCTESINQREICCRWNYDRGSKN